MNIIIAASVTAYYSMEEKYFVKVLEKELLRNGHRVDSFMLPTVDEPLAMPEHMTMMSMFDMGHETDMVICVGYGAFAVNHPNKKICLFTVLGQLHEGEGWNNQYGSLATDQYVKLKSNIINTERNIFNSSEVFTFSNALKEDFENRYGTSPEVFNQPDYDFMDKKRINLNCKNYFLTATNLHRTDRMDILLESISKSTCKEKLVICLEGAKEMHKNALHDMISRLDIEEKVIIYEGKLPANMLNNAKAYISLQYKSRKTPYYVYKSIESNIPVITFEDCTSILEIVNQKNGIVVINEVDELAKTLNKLKIKKQNSNNSLFGSIEHIAKRITGTI